MREKDFKPDWKQSPLRPELRRVAILQSGFDCGPYGFDCKHEVKGDHGQHCSEWWFVVGDGKYVLSLVVMAGDFPRGLKRAPEGTSIALHAPEATQHDDIKDGGAGDQCPYIEGGRCFQSPGCSYAAKLYERIGSGVFDETPAFWEKLEREFLEYREQQQIAVAKAPVQCPTCAGKGVIYPKERT